MSAREGGEAAVLGLAAAGEREELEPRAHAEQRGAQMRACERLAAGQVEPREPGAEQRVARRGGGGGGGAAEAPPGDASAASASGLRCVATKKNVESKW